MMTRVYSLVLVAIQSGSTLQAMDFSYAPSSEYKVEIHASHGTFAVSTPYSNQAAPQMPVLPVGLLNNPIFNPTMSYNLLQLAQMQAVRTVSSGASHSSHPEPVDSQLKAQLLRARLHEK